MSVIISQDRSHGLDSVGEDDLLVGVSFKIIVSAAVDDLCVLQQRRLGEHQDKYLT